MKWGFFFFFFLLKGSFNMASFFKSLLIGGLSSAHRQMILKVDRSVIVIILI